MIHLIKKAVRKQIERTKRALAPDIDFLHQDSPLNNHLAELTSRADLAKYQQYTSFRQNFEQQLLKHIRWGYVKSNGKHYQLNAFKGILSLREAAIDNTGLNARMRFSLQIIKKYFSSAKQVYLSEHGTNYHQQLARLFEFDLTTSIYKPGEPLHQDLTKLSYGDNSFDLCLSFEDLEHIPDYPKALAELHRVTRPGGHVLMSTPFISGNDHTMVRAKINEQGETVHLMEPEYHGDPVVPEGILCFYHFGWDLLDEFRKAGFSSVKIITGYDTRDLILDELLFIVAQK